MNKEKVIKLFGYCNDYIEYMIIPKEYRYMIKEFHIQMLTCLKDDPNGDNTETHFMNYEIEITIGDIKSVITIPNHLYYLVNILKNKIKLNLEYDSRNKASK